jgi:hypothetical protein
VVQAFRRDRNSNHHLYIAGLVPTAKYRHRRRSWQVRTDRKELMEHGLPVRSPQARRTSSTEGEIQNDAEARHA